MKFVNGLLSTILPLFFFCFRKSNRSIDGKRKRNQRTKNRQRVNKAKLKCQLELLKKDDTIGKLENQVERLKAVKTLKPILKNATSILTRTARATNFNSNHYNVTKSRDYVLQKLEGIPKVPLENYKSIDFSVGSGVFGSIKLGKLLSLNLIVAEKILDKKTSNKSLLAEVVIHLTLSGSKFVPFCFGLVENSKSILMEFLGGTNGDSFLPYPTLASMIHKRNLNISILKHVCRSVLEAVIYIHKKGILHNDIKSDNVVVAQARVVLIDFGKATLIKCPVIYNISPNSKEQNKYNQDHRHLAYELRNVPQSKQTIFSDIYSVGYMFKHSAAALPYDPIIELGRQMKTCQPIERLTLEVALKSLAA